MQKSLRYFVAAGVAAVAVLALSSTPTYAQPRVLVNSQSIVNPYYRVAPGLPLNQAAYNINVLGRAYSNVPPWVYGYNPYPAPIIVTSPFIPTPYVPPAYVAPYPYYNPYLYNYPGYPFAGYPRYFP